jgi:hypothetical protein
MSWHRTNDSFWCDPKVLKIPRRHRNAAAGLWIRTCSWCSTFEDVVNKPQEAGHLPSHVLAEIDGTKNIAAILVDVGLWELDPAGDGWRIHDWKDYRQDREKVIKKLADGAARQARYAARKTAENIGRRSVDGRSTVIHAANDLRPTGRGTTSPAQTETPDASVMRPRPDPTRRGGEGTTKGALRPASAVAPAGPPAATTDADRDPKAPPILGGPKASPSVDAQAMWAAQLEASPWEFTANLPTGPVRIVREVNPLDDGHAEITVCIEFDYAAQADAGRITETLGSKFKAVGDRERRAHHCRLAVDQCDSWYSSEEIDPGEHRASVTVADARVAEVDAEMRAIVEAVVDDEQQQSAIISDPEDEFGVAE